VAKEAIFVFWYYSTVKYHVFSRLFKWDKL